MTELPDRSPPPLAANQQYAQPQRSSIDAFTTKAPTVGTLEESSSHQSDIPAIHQHVTVQKEVQDTAPKGSVVLEQANKQFSSETKILSFDEPINGHDDEALKSRIDQGLHKLKQPSIGHTGALVAMPSEDNRQEVEGTHQPTAKHVGNEAAAYHLGAVSLERLRPEDISPIPEERSVAKPEPITASAFGLASLAPPVTQHPMASPGLGGPSLNLDSPLGPSSANIADAATATPSRDAYDVNRPTCSLNLVCYRGGAQGCVLYQVYTILESRFPDPNDFKKMISKDASMICSDEQFFRELNRAYRSEMCGFWRRYLSLKTLRGLKLLAYSPVTRPTVVPLDDFVLQEMFYAYRHPNSVKTKTSWIEWVFRLRDRNKRHALEFVEGWNSTRVIIAATVPWLISCLVGVVWTAMGKDAQTAFTVAGFILTSGTVILALLAVISGIESSARGYTPIG